MAQILAMIVNERQGDWDAHLPHADFGYNNSVSAATGLASNEVQMKRLPCLPLTVLDRKVRSETPKSRSQPARVCRPGCRLPAKLVRSSPRTTRPQRSPRRTSQLGAVRWAQATPHLRHRWLGVDLQHRRYHPARDQSGH